MAIFKNNFSKEIYEQTYEFANEGIENTWKRIAIDLASVEKDTNKWTLEFEKILTDFKFIPGGRIYSNAGIDLKGTTYINCFVDGFIGKNQDSMEGIMDALKRQALILKSEGGYGFCADVMRPRGGYISGIANESPGAVKMLEMWDTQSGVITAGSGNISTKGKKKIRKGAQMVTMSIWHPDIEEFIIAKQTAGRLARFNMSVLITDKFMNAVKNNLSWELVYPDFEIDKEIYDNNWDGNIDKWIANGGKTIVYKKYDNANYLWDLIMKSTYTRNEPGVLFIDTINKMNNLYYCEHISATNPCGEQPIPVGAVCLIGALNLTQFVFNGDWDYDELKSVIHVAVRMLDNVNDITHVPLEHQRKNLQDKRRIGLGVMGYGSALMMMQLRYGSDEAIDKTHDLMKFIMNESYYASAMLANEKGSFRLYNESEYLNGKHVAKLESYVVDAIKRYGIRNSHLNTIAPTGNTGILANNVSGGLEPLFSPEYDRTSICPNVPNGLIVPTSIDFSGQISYPNWTWVKEGDVSILRSEYEGKIYKIDSIRGLCVENHVEDYAVTILKEQGIWDPCAEWAAATYLLNADDHIKTMEVFAQYIDSAISKTINLPANYSYDDFKSIYYKMHESGIKGGTTYRDGTMTSVLSVKDETLNEYKRLEKNTAIKRPKTLKCQIKRVKIKNIVFDVIIGLFDNQPYEVFVVKGGTTVLCDTGTITKIKSGMYNLATCKDEEICIVNDLADYLTEEEEAITRLVSMALRHGVETRHIVEQLQKPAQSLTSFNKAIARVIKMYIKDGEKSTTKCTECGGTLIFQEGCLVCKDCGHSKCS